MSRKSEARSDQAPATERAAPAPGRDPVAENIESILALYKREEEKIGRWQRMLEGVSAFMGTPRYLAAILLFVVLWIAANQILHHLARSEFDPPPFFWLQGVLGLGALLTATVVLIKQERLSKFEEQRAHLALQVVLLTEQKASKLIDMIEELRRDLPMVEDRHDPDAAVLKQPTDPHEVLAALDERRDAGEAAKADEKPKKESPDEKKS
jgi:uncharacterized membrane protein